MSATSTLGNRSRARPGSGGEPKRRPKISRRTVIVVSSLLVVVAVVWLAYFSSFFGTNQVVVNGEKSVSTAEISQAAVVPLGRPMLRQDLGAIQQRVASIRPIESATVVRSWPNTLIISVTERRPLLAVAEPGGYLLVDREGVGFSSVTSIPSRVALVEVNPDDPALLREVGIAVASWPADLRKKVARIRASTGNDIALTMKNGVEVRWGSSTDSPLKAELVAVLVKKKSTTVIDVSSPHNPAVR